MEKELTKGEILKKKTLALKRVKLTEPSAYWQMLELEGKHCLRDI